MKTPMNDYFNFVSDTEHAYRQAIGIEMYQLLVIMGWISISNFIDYLQGFCANQLEVGRSYFIDKLEISVVRQEGVPYLHIQVIDNEIYLSKIESRCLASTMSRLLSKCDLNHFGPKVLDDDNY
jgi:hypothetical protein